MSICKICFSEIPLKGINGLRKDICICPKCFKEFNPRFKEFMIDGVKGLALFNYDETIKHYLYQLKGCYDYELAPIFINHFVYELRLRFKGYVIVCFPSNKEDDEIRGFNHVEEIFRQLKLPYAHVLRKKVSFKQSDLSKEEREKVASKIEGYDLDSIRHKKVLLVDDVMTTGSSLKAGISILKGANPCKIQVLVLSKKQENKINDNSLVKSLKKHFAFYRKFMR